MKIMLKNEWMWEFTIQIICLLMIFLKWNNIKNLTLNCLDTCVTFWIYRSAQISLSSTLQATGSLSHSKLHAYFWMYCSTVAENYLNIPFFVSFCFYMPTLWVFSYCPISLLTFLIILQNSCTLWITYWAVP